MRDRLGVAHRIVEGIVSMLCLAKVFEVFECVFDEALVYGAEVGRAVAEWVLSEKVVEIPVDKLPVEAIVVGNEHCFKVMK